MAHAGHARTGRGAGRSPREFHECDSLPDRFGRMPQPLNLTRADFGGFVALSEMAARGRAGRGHAPIGCHRISPQVLPRPISTVCRGPNARGVCWRAVTTDHKPLTCNALFAAGHFTLPKWKAPNNALGTASALDYLGGHGGPLCLHLDRRQLSEELAMLVRKDLIEYQFDTFMDVENLDSGEFERMILSQIEVREHFIVLLQGGSLDRIGEDGDWLRREIAHALAHDRNVVPVIAHGFEFRRDLVLPPDVARLPSLNALPIQRGYFDEAMKRLRTRFLKMPSKPVARPRRTGWRSFMCGGMRHRRPASIARCMTRSTVSTAAPPMSEWGVMVTLCSTSSRGHCCV